MIKESYKNQLGKSYNKLLGFFAKQNWKYYWEEFEGELKGLWQYSKQIIVIWCCKWVQIKLLYKS